MVALGSRGGRLYLLSSERLEQKLGGAIAKGTFELVHHQSIAVAAQPLECQRGPGFGDRPSVPAMTGSLGR
jgi:hypothetical protein